MLSFITGATRIAIAAFCLSGCTAAWRFNVRNNTEETVFVSFGKQIRTIDPGRSAKLPIAWEVFESPETKELIARSKEEVIAHRSGKLIMEEAKVYKSEYPNVFVKITPKGIEVPKDQHSP